MIGYIDGLIEEFTRSGDDKPVYMFVSHWVYIRLYMQDEKNIVERIPIGKNMFKYKDITGILLPIQTDGDMTVILTGDCMLYNKVLS